MTTRDSPEERVAFTRLFSSVGRQLRARLRRVVGNPADVEEIAQEACLQVWRDRHTIRENPEGFLFATAFHLASNRRKQELRRKPVIDDRELGSLEQAGQAADLLTPEHCLASRQELFSVSCEFSALPPICQNVVMANLAGLTQEQIAARLGISQSQVSRYLKKAVTAFRQARERANATEAHGERIKNEADAPIQKKEADGSTGRRR